MSEFTVLPTELSGSENIDSLSDFVRGDEQSTENAICKFLAYDSRDGKYVRYKAIKAGCVRVVYSRGGKVTSIGANTRLKKGDYIVVDNGNQDYGFQCC